MGVRTAHQESGAQNGTGIGSGARGEAGWLLQLTCFVGLYNSDRSSCFRSVPIRLGSHPCHHLANPILRNRKAQARTSYSQSVDMSNEYSQVVARRCLKREEKL